METSASSKKSAIQPKTMAELLPCLRGILSKDGIQTFTAIKKPRSTLQTRTAEKVAKPLTIAEMRADILALKVQSPRRFAQELNSNKKKNWNSSVKVDKTISHTANGLKNKSVRKVLNFQTKPKVPSNPSSRYTLMTSETPKFPKPQMRPKNTLPAKNVRISGICNIPETPIMYRPTKSRYTLANKENITSFAENRKSVIPKSIPKKSAVIISRPLIDTPLSNDSWKSSCDNSFLQNEKDINDLEEKANALENEKTFENIAEITPPVSTPFTEYQSVQEFFHNSNKEDSGAHDNTIMCFDRTSVNFDTNKREDSVIVSLCELLSKATMTQNKLQPKTELEELLQLEKQAEEHLNNIDNVLEMLKTMKESELKALASLKHLIQEKINNVMEVTKDQKYIKEEKAPTSEKSPVICKPVSVIKSCFKSPSYKIPKKNTPLRKKVFYNSMPTTSSGSQISPKENKALNIYIKMKEQMNFLNTPVVKTRQTEALDTPAITSHNLQVQLDKLYMGS